MVTNPSQTNPVICVTIARLSTPAFNLGKLESLLCGEEVRTSMRFIIDLLKFHTTFNIISNHLMAAVHKFMCTSVTLNSLPHNPDF